MKTLNLIVMAAVLAVAPACKKKAPPAPSPAPTAEPGSAAMPPPPDPGSAGSAGSAAAAGSAGSAATADANADFISVFSPVPELTPRAPDRKSVV